MAGLFDYQSPENMRAARLQPLLVSGAQMGQQPLLSQLVSQMSNAGANIGATGAGMLGLQLPEEARQQQVQGIMQGVDLNSPEGLMEASKRFSAANMPKEAELAADKANTVQKQNYEMGALSNSQKLQQAITDIPPTATYEQRAAAENAAIRQFGTTDQKVAITKQEGISSKEASAVTNRGRVLSAVFGEGIDKESANAIAVDSGLFAKVMEDKLKYRDTPTKVVTSADGVRLVHGNTGAEIANYGLPSKVGGNTVVVSPSQGAYGKGIGAGLAAEDLEFVKSAKAVATSIPKMYETADLIATSDDLVTGIGSGIIKDFYRAIDQFTVDKEAGKKVSDTEYLDALMGSEVFTQINALGIGARGLDTPAEREFLRSVMTGTTTLNEKTLTKLTDLRISVAERAVKKYNDRLEAGDFDNYMKEGRVTLQPIVLPERTPRPKITSMVTQLKSNPQYASLTDKQAERALRKAGKIK